MSRFFKYLILVAAIANLAILFVYDGVIPENLPIPFIRNETEKEENAGEDAAPETAVLPEETQEKEPETEPETVKEPEEAETAMETGEAGETETASETETEEEPELLQCRIISEYGSNVRSGPGPDYDVVASYPYDTVLTLTGEPDMGWYPILAEDGTEGYIFETQILLPEGMLQSEAAY